jgi:hypothetical protein
MVSKSWRSQVVFTYDIRATCKLRRTSNKNLKFLNISLRDFIQIYLGSLPHMKREVFSGGRPEASKRNLNFQGATWHQF